MGQIHKDFVNLNRIWVLEGLVMWNTWHVLYVDCSKHYHATLKVGMYSELPHGNAYYDLSLSWTRLKPAVPPSQIHIISMELSNNSWKLVT